MPQVIARSLPNQELQGIKEMFKAIDEDNSGITVDELREGLRKKDAEMALAEVWTGCGRCVRVCARGVWRRMRRSGLGGAAQGGRRAGAGRGVREGVRGGVRKDGDVGEMCEGEGRQAGAGRGIVPPASHARLLNPLATARLP